MSKVFMGIKQKRFQESLTQTRAIGRASMLRGCQAARKGKSEGGFVKDNLFRSQRK